MKVRALCLSLCVVSSHAEAATYVFAGEAIAIPTSGPADPSFIQVSGVQGAVTRISVSFKNFMHYYGQEIMVALSNPNGWSTLLFAAPPCRFDGIDVGFADDAPEIFADACDYALPAGTYTPGFSNAEREFTIPIAPLRPFFETLNELTLPDPNGRWILWSEDFTNGDGGTIDSWELTIETDWPEEPIPAEHD